MITKKLAKILTLLICLPGIAFGQDAVGGALMDRMSKLDRDLQTLQRYVYRNGNATSQASSNITPAIDTTRIEARLSTMESQVSKITGDLEVLTFQMEKQNQNLRALTNDLEFRVQKAEDQVRQTSSQLEKAQQAIQLPSLQRRPEPLAEGEEKIEQKTNGDKKSVLPEGSTRERYDYAFDLLRKAEYEKAEQAFRAFLDLYPDDILSSNAWYWMAETLYVRGKHSDAAVEFLNAYQEYPKGAKAADSLLKLSLSLRQLGNIGESCASLKRLSKEFPTAEAEVKKRAASEWDQLKCR